MEQTHLMVPMAIDQIIIEAKCTGAHWVLNAKWGHLKAGHVWCNLTDSRLCLAEFWVEEALVMTWHRFNWLRCMLGIRCKTRNVRRLGIGSKLMTRLLVEAKRRGISEIWGSVTADDIETTPHLLAIYKGHGFTVCDRDDECLPNAAKKVSMKMIFQETMTLPSTCL